MDEMMSNVAQYEKQMLLKTSQAKNSAIKPTPLSGEGCSDDDIYTVERIVDKKLPTPYITAIDKDDEDGLDKREIYLWLAFPPASGDDNNVQQVRCMAMR